MAFCNSESKKGLFTTLSQLETPVGLDIQIWLTSLDIGIYSGATLEQKFLNQSLLVAEEVDVMHFLNFLAVDQKLAIRVLECMVKV